MKRDSRVIIMVSGLLVAAPAQAYAPRLGTVVHFGAHEPPTPRGTLGACCDQATGICETAASAEQCMAPGVFTPNATCGDLQPSCGKGACCLQSGGCVEVVPPDCIAPATFVGLGVACAQPNPPCGLPGCGHCQLHGDVAGLSSFAYPDCLYCIEDALYVLDAFGDANPLSNFPRADLFPCGGGCGVDLDDLLSSSAAFSGSYDCPHPCAPGACCFGAGACEDEFSFFSGGMSETDCFLESGSYCGDATTCGQVTCNGVTCVTRQPQPLLTAGSDPTSVRTGATVTITCQPVGGSTVVGGQIVEIECRLTTMDAVSLLGFQVDLPCALPGGSTGTMTSVGITTDPNGDGLPGPGAGGIPFLFEGTSIGVINGSRCVVAGTSGKGEPPDDFNAGHTGYLGTNRFQVSSCAVGDFLFVLENFSNPSEECDATKVRDGSRNLVAFTTSPLILSAVLPAYGDLEPDGDVDVDDLLCVVIGFSNFAVCPAGDIASPTPCTPDGMIDVDDILAVLDAFSGLSTCPSPCG